MLVTSIILQIMVLSYLHKAHCLVGYQTSAQLAGCLSIQQYCESDSHT